jgi:hypothetical protein
MLAFVLEFMCTSILVFDYTENVSVIDCKKLA